MRQVPASIINAITPERKFSGELVVRNTHMEFETQAESADLTYTQTVVHPTYGIVQIALRLSQPARVFYRRTTTPEQGFPAFVDTGINIWAGSFPTITSSGRLWTVNTNGVLCYRDLGANGFSSPTNTSVSFSDPTVLLAGVSNGVYYIVNRQYVVDPSYIGFFNGTNNIVRPGGLAILPARMGAARKDGIDYIYFRDDLRTHYVSRDGSAWSVERDLISVGPGDDYTTYTHTFRFGGVSTIGSEVVITGRIHRGEGFDAFMIGPDKPTLGRELYITNFNNPYVSSWTGGDLVEYNGVLYYLTNKSISTCTNGGLFGTIHPSRVHTFRNFNNLNITYDQKGNSSISVEIPDDGEFEIEAGMEIEPKVTYGDSGQMASLGVYSIEMVQNVIGPSGKSGQINGVEKSVGWLRRWLADVDYDYWSSDAKFHCSPENGRLIRVDGQWKKIIGDYTEHFMLERINDPGLLYANVHPGKNHFIQAKFRYVYGDWLPKFGLVVDYVNNTGIYIIWSKTAHNGGPGFAVIRDNGSGPDMGQVITSASLALTYNCEIYLKAVLIDNRLRFYYMIEYGGDPDPIQWTQLFNLNVRTSGKAGRPGIYVVNGTRYTTTPGFDSASPVVPVANPNVFNVGETIIVDDEIMIIQNKSGTNIWDTYPYEYRTVTQQTIRHYTHEAAKVSSSPIHASNPVTNDSYFSKWFYFDIADNYPYPSVESVIEKYKWYALVTENGTQAVMIDKYNPSIWRQWVPNLDAELETGKTWQDYVGKAGYGHWEFPNVMGFRVHPATAAFLRGAKVYMWPALWLGANGQYRAQRNTTRTAHSEGLVSLWWDLDQKGLVISDVHAANLEIDNSLADMLTEVSRKAGIINVAHQKFYSSTFNISHAGWNVTSDAQNTGRDIVGHPFVFKFRINSGSEAGFGFRDVGDTIYTFTSSSMSVYHASGTTVELVERIPLPFTRSGWIRVSYNPTNMALGIWMNDYPIAMLESVRRPGRVFFTSNGNASISVDWDEADYRVDSMILDIGRAGDAFLREIIGSKRILYRGTPNGVQFFRNRTVVNAGSPLDMFVSVNDVKGTYSVTSRVRIQGLIDYEKINFDLLKKYGNHFALFGMDDLETQGQFIQEADYLFNDFAGEGRPLYLTGAADPRVEVDDIIEVNTPSGVRRVIVKSLTYIMQTAPGSAIFDMQIGAIDA